MSITTKNMAQKSVAYLVTGKNLNKIYALCEKQKTISTNKLIGLIETCHQNQKNHCQAILREILK